MRGRLWLRALNPRFRILFDKRNYARLVIKSWKWEQNYKSWATIRNNKYKFKSIWGKWSVAKDPSLNSLVWLLEGRSVCSDLVSEPALEVSFGMDDVWSLSNFTCSVDLMEIDAETPLSSLVEDRVLLQGKTGATTTSSCSTLAHLARGCCVSLTFLLFLLTDRSSFVLTLWVVARSDITMIKCTCNLQNFRDKRSIWQSTMRDNHQPLK